ncbi:MAG: MarR family winged helix-turn-helix transcriptional regulator [Erysipelotrichaceae bacterium]|nr:MarR family winged helix-turn-helix transcriptional regulator [Erysipelotrichaceae bacterium]
MDNNTELLNAWVMVATGIKTNRILNELSTNEMYICNYLYANKRASFSELVDTLNLLKSQMTREISELLNKGFITKKADNKDKRKSVIELTEEGISAYLREHEHTMDIAKTVSEKLGNLKTEKLIELLKEAVGALDKND